MLQLFMNQLPTPNPSKNTIFTNKNSGHHAKWPTKKHGSSVRSETDSLSADLLASSLPLPALCPNLPSLRPFSLPPADPPDAPGSTLHPTSSRKPSGPATALGSLLLHLLTSVPGLPFTSPYGSPTWSPRPSWRQWHAGASSYQLPRAEC